MNERGLVKRIPGYSNLNESARKKAFVSFINDCKIVKEAKVPGFFPNTRRKIQKRSAHKRIPQSEDFRAGTQHLLRTVELFEDHGAGVRCLSYILAGLRCSAIRKCAPNIRFALAVADHSPEVAEIFRSLVQMIVTRKRWKGKHCRIKRSAILDCQSGGALVGHRFHDFSRAIVEGKYKLSASVPYVDTVTCIIGADSVLLREASSYMGNACTFLIGCGTND